MQWSAADQSRNVAGKRDWCLFDSRPTLLVTLVVVVALGWFYARTGTAVNLEIDGRLWRVRTHQGAVSALLREIGLPLRDEDVVVPALASALYDGQTVTVRRARQVLIDADGGLLTRLTHSRTIGQVLMEAGLTVGAYDVITMDGSATAMDGQLPERRWEPQRWPSVTNAAHSQRAASLPVRVKVQRAVPLSIRDESVETTVYSVSRTVGEELLKQGIVLYLGDRVQPMLGSLLTAGMNVEVERAKVVDLRVDGEQIRLRTQARDVAWLLNEASVHLHGQDYVVPGPDTEVTPGMLVRVVRVLEDWVQEAETIPYETVWRSDSGLELDQLRTDQTGTNGVRKRQVHFIYEDGVQKSREVVEEWVERQPTTKIISYGTKVVIRELETPDGVVRYWRKIRVLATSYSAATSGKTRDHPEYGITRLGWRARKGIIAVDPKVIKLRTNMYVPGYGAGIAGDTGGMIKGRWIDLCYEEDDLILWKKWLDVYLLEPVTPAAEINYLLPDTPRERR